MAWERGYRGFGEFNYPRGVAVAGNRVFVCDRGNHRIQVLTTELQPVKQFGCIGNGGGQFNTVVGVAVDKKGIILYVSDYKNHCIQAFTRDGQFIRSFGKKGSGQGRLDCPYGVCVDSGYVYVAESGNKRVSVFTKDGQFVTSFGQGHVGVSYGVCVDKDGFVYVCSDKCVVVF